MPATRGCRRPGARVAGDGRRAAQRSRSSTGATARTATSPTSTRRRRRITWTIGAVRRTAATAWAASGGGGGGGGATAAIPPPSSGSRRTGTCWAASIRRAPFTARSSRGRAAPATPVPTSTSRRVATTSCWGEGDRRCSHVLPRAHGSVGAQPAVAGRARAPVFRLSRPRRCVAPRPGRAAGARLLLEGIADVREESLDAAEHLIDRIRDEQRQAAFRAAYRQAEVPLVQAAAGRATASCSTSSRSVSRPRASARASCWPDSSIRLH